MQLHYLAFGRVKSPLLGCQLVATPEISQVCWPGLHLCLDGDRGYAVPAQLVRLRHLPHLEGHHRVPPQRLLHSAQIVRELRPSKSYSRADEVTMR